MLLQNRLSHPVGFIVLTLSYSFFMISIAGLTAMLTLYQTHQLHFSNDNAFSIFGAFMALLMVLPLPGGYFAGKFGYLPATKIGLFFSIIGMAALSIKSAFFFYLGLSLVVIGNGFATPALWCIVDHCYDKNDPLRDSAFTLFYLCFNIGAAIGVFFGGEIGEKLGFGLAFNLGAIATAVSFIVLFIFKKLIKEANGRSINGTKNCSSLQSYLSIFLISLAGIPISIFLFNHLEINNYLMLVLLFFMVGLILLKIRSFEDKKTRRKLLAFLFLTLISVVFWILYSLEPSFISVFISTNVNQNFLGINIPAESFYTFNCLFIILIGLVLNRVWRFLSLKNQNPSLIFKFITALIIVGLGFMYVAWQITHYKTTLMPAYHLVIAYAIFSTAELLVGPLGIGMVGNLAPESMEGILMGFWELIIGVAGVLASFIAQIPRFPTVNVTLLSSNLIYFKVFLFIGLSAVVTGVLLFPIASKVKALMTK